MTLDIAKPQDQRKIINCYEFSGQVCGDTSFRLTTHDVQVTIIDGTEEKTFSPGQLRRSTIDRVSDSFDGVNITINNVEPFASVIMARSIEGITCKIYAVYTNDIDDTEFVSEDFEILFNGQSSGSAVQTAKTITVSFASWDHLTQNSILTYQHQRTCNWVLYGIGCEVNESLHQVNGTITSIQSNAILLNIQVNNATFINDTSAFILGVVTFLDGSKRSISNITGTNPYTFTLGLGRAPISASINQAVVISKGCDKLHPTCKSRFDNSSNFGGFPYIRTRNPMLDKIG